MRHALSQFERAGLLQPGSLNDRAPGLSRRALLRTIGMTAAIPVVALTGHALAGMFEGAKRAGCDAFVTKPCLPEDLVKEIRAVLDLD